MTTKELVVLVNDQLVGRVTQGASGRLAFDYHDAWLANPSAIPLSLSMPLTNPHHGDGAIRAYMWGLLPDSEATLSAWGTRFGASPRNPFALLTFVGEDLQGAVQMVPPECLDSLRQREGVTRLSTKTLAERFRELMRQPGLTQFTPTGGQFSLAGAQPKKALYLVKGRWYEPRGRTPSTHILKPPIPNLAGQVENEALCLRLAPELNLPAPPIWIECFDDLPVVVIERYDRVRMDGRRRLAIDATGGEVRRVHQEDCCQALQVMPQRKYQNEGGPGIKDIMTLLSGSTRPSDDRDRFMRAQAYNFVIGGSDAHGKNYGLLLAARGRFRLAPLYDIISILPYISNRKDAKLAMSVDRRYRFDEIEPRHWEAQARAAGFSPDRTLAHLRDIIARLPDAALSLSRVFQGEGMLSPDLERLVNLLTERARKLAGTYGSQEMNAADQRLPGL
ncbi:MAG: type II toxin-antitoxin system HipA family toxin [Hyphomicrobiaceae bacterium]